MKKIILAMFFFILLASSLAEIRERTGVQQQMVSKENLAISDLETYRKCEQDADCRHVFCPQVVGMDTPQCRKGVCVCGPNPKLNLTEMNKSRLTVCMRIRAEIKERIGVSNYSEEELKTIREMYRECLPQPLPFPGRLEASEIVSKYREEKKNLTENFREAIRELNELKVEIALNSNLTGKELVEKIHEINEQRKQIVKEYVEKLHELNLARQEELKEIIQETKIGKEVEIDGLKVNVTRIVINVNGKEVEINPGDNVTINVEGIAVRSNIRLRLREGRLEDEKTNATLNFTPEKIRERVRERIRETILERKEKSLIYKVNAEKSGRILGIVPVNLRVNYEISAENGETISVTKPWWSFLVIG
ncbi:MAG: hypothetical protein QXD89_00455 [Candidatus Aenigmatarchaeota archaeon]